MQELAILLVVFAAVQGQDPQRCVTPTLWEGRVLEYQSRSKISYDEVNRRIRRISEFDFTDERDFYDDVYLYNLGVRYSLNLRTRNCIKLNLTEPFRRVGIPTFSKFRGEAYIGASLQNAGVLVSLWDGPLPTGGFYFGAWTVLGCIPVNDGIFTNATGYKSQNFYDVTLGISDPNVFLPPSECL